MTGFVDSRAMLPFEKRIPGEKFGGLPLSA